MREASAPSTPPAPEVRHLDIGPAELEVTLGGRPGTEAPLVAAAHPADAFGAPALNLLAEASLARVVTVNPRGLGASKAKQPVPDDATLETMADDLEAARRSLGLAPWTFWGMSGGGFLALVYVHRYPEAISGLILDSSCACFHQRLGDPECIASPLHPFWREPLEAAGLAGAAGIQTEGSEAEPVRDHGGAEPAGGAAGEWIDLAGGASAFVVEGRVRIVSPVEASPAMRRAMPAMLAYDARPWLGAIRVPTLVLCGAADPFVPLAHARALHEGIAGSEFVAVEGAGHVPVVARNPQALAAVRRFLGTEADPD